MSLPPNKLLKPYILIIGLIFVMSVVGLSDVTPDQFVLFTDKYNVLLMLAIITFEETCCMLVSANGALVDMLSQRPYWSSFVRYAPINSLNASSAPISANNCLPCPVLLVLAILVSNAITQFLSIGNSFANSKSTMCLYSFVKKF